jgi:ribosomal protein L37AE/L43A
MKIKGINYDINYHRGTSTYREEKQNSSQDKNNLKNLLNQMKHTKRCCDNCNYYIGDICIYYDKEPKYLPSKKNNCKHFLSNVLSIKDLETKIKESMYCHTCGKLILKPLDFYKKNCKKCKEKFKNESLTIFSDLIKE